MFWLFHLLPPAGSLLRQVSVLAGLPPAAAVESSRDPTAATGPCKGGRLGSERLVVN